MMPDTAGRGRAEREMSALSRCVGVPAGCFAAQFWDQRPLISQAAQLPAPFDDLFSADAVDEIFSRLLLTEPFVRIAKDGKAISNTLFTIRHDPAGVVAPDRVMALFASGATIVLQRLQHLWPPLGEFTRRLAAELGHPTQANAYLTPPAHQGFPAHYDVHDAFILQIAGRKQWTIHEPVVQRPLPAQRWHPTSQQIAVATVGQPWTQVMLEPGDVMYLPRGWVHSALAQDEQSLHVTIGVPPQTRISVGEALLDMMADEPEFRRTLSDTAATAPRIESVSETITRLRSWLDQLNPAQVFERLSDATAGSDAIVRLRPVSHVNTVTNLGPNDTVTARPGLRWTLREKDDGVVLELPDRAIPLPASCSPAVAVLMDGRTHRVRDLPGLATADQVRLVRLMLKDAVVVSAHDS